MMHLNEEVMMQNGEKMKTMSVTMEIESMSTMMPMEMGTNLNSNN
jgi:hypothetical protein